MGLKLTHIRAAAPWAIYLALAAALFVFGLRNSPSPPNLPSYGEQQAPDPEYRAGGSDCEPAQVRSGRSRIGPDVGENCEDKAESHRQTEADLVQQTRAADAAQEAVRYAYYQSLVLLWATICGSLTLIAAIFAAAFAKRAAVATEASLDHAKTDAASRDRPRLLFTEIDINRINVTADGYCSWMGDGTVENIGKLPGFDIKIYCRAYRPEGLLPHDPLPHVVGLDQSRVMPMDAVIAGKPVARALMGHVTRAEGDFANPFFVATLMTYAQAGSDVRFKTIQVFEVGGQMTDGGTLGWGQWQGPEIQQAVSRIWKTVEMT